MVACAGEISSKLLLSRQPLGRCRRAHSKPLKCTASATWAAPRTRGTRARSAIIESTLICEYLDDTFPEPRLIPSDPWQRTRMRLWSKMVDEGLFEGVTEISFSAMFRERMRGMPEDIRARRFRNIGDPRRRDRFMSTYELGVRSPFVKHGIAAYERAFKILEDTLAETGPWILGRSPSLADINLMPFAARLEYLGLLNLWIKDRPR